MCVITACGVQCLVAGCRGSGAEQQAVSPGRGMLHDCVVQHPGAGGRQHRGCIILQAVTHSLVLLKMGKIIARNMLS